jgi:integrase
MRLAHLGLRAGEVAQLKFVDIDWSNGSITGESHGIISLRKYQT